MNHESMNTSGPTCGDCAGPMTSGEDMAYGVCEPCWVKWVNSVDGAKEIERKRIANQLRDRMARHLELARTYRADAWSRHVHEAIADALSKAAEEAITQ